MRLGVLAVPLSVPMEQAPAPSPASAPTPAPALCREGFSRAVLTSSPVSRSSCHALCPSSFGCTKKIPPGGERRIIPPKIPVGEGAGSRPAPAPTPRNNRKNKRGVEGGNGAGSGSGGMEKGGPAASQPRELGAHAHARLHTRTRVSPAEAVKGTRAPAAVMESAGKAPGEAPGEAR